MGLGIDFDFGAIGAGVGAIVGGAAGFMVGGPAGAIAGAKIGAGVGAIGGSGVAGDSIQDYATMGASAQERAEAYANRARERAAELQKEQNRLQYIQQIRAARIQRARTANMATMEPGVSSGNLGALSSIGSQVSSNVNYMQTSTNLLNSMQLYENKYNRAASQASLANSRMSTIMSTLTSSAMSSYGTPKLPVYDVTGTAATGGNVFMNTGSYNG